MKTHTEGLSSDLPTSLADLVPDTLSHFVGSITNLPRKSDDLGDNEFCD